MTEILRFRHARSPQRKQLDSRDLILLYPDGPSPFIQSLTTAQNTDAVAGELLQNNQLLFPARRTRGELDRLDAFLTRRSNRVSQRDILAFMDGRDAMEIGVVKDFLATRRPTRTELADLLVATLLVPYLVPTSLVVTQELRDDLVRKITILGLLELIADAPTPARSEDEVFAALRWRLIVLPAELEGIQRHAAATAWTHAAQFASPAQLNASRRRFVTRTGFADLFVLKSEWLRYEAGEVAHIENVMAKETKDRKHVRLDESETTLTSEADIATFNAQDSQTTDRFELHEEASRDTDLAVHVDGQVNTSGQYGPTKVDTHIGGSLDYSQHDSQQRATTQARESVSRTITRVEQQVRNIRVARTLTRIEETNAHALKNDTSAHIAGIYRWVDKIQRFQLFRYPNRLLLEFQIPEPGAWWRWLRGVAANAGLRTKEPEAFTLNGGPTAGSSPALKFTDITPDNYATIGARYATLGLNPPPRPILVAESFAGDSPSPYDPSEVKRNSSLRQVQLGEIGIPAGYIATNAWWRTLADRGPWTLTPDSNDLPRMAVTLEIGNNSQTLETGTAGLLGESQWNVPSHGPLPLSGIPPVPIEYGGLTQAKMKVGLRTEAIRAYNVSVTVECKPTPETIDRWKVSTYEKIAEAYYALKRAHDEEANAARIAAGVVIEGDSPARNAEVIREQLKLGVLRMLFGDATPGSFMPFTWAGLISAPDPVSGPSLNAAAAATRAPIIQFLEQAFEWDKLTYVLYPFFWGAAWKDVADIKSTDPEFAQFLRAGSARVVVAARPGFESQVQLFLDFGVIWSGGPAPVIGDPHYLSIADEIRTIHRPPDDGEPGEWWDERLPTTLVWLDGANPLSEKPKVQRTLGPPPPN